MEGPQLGIGVLAKISSDRRRNSSIQSGSFFSREICRMMSGVRPLATL